MRRAAGFTLVELVIVIVLLAIVATISVQFVALSTRGAIDVSARQQRALQGVVISEQISRELREAFPLSIRVADNCLEWLPIEAGTAYTDLPDGGNTIAVAPFANTPPQWIYPGGGLWLWHLCGFTLWQCQSGTSIANHRQYRQFSVSSSD